MIVEIQKKTVRCLLERSFKMFSDYDAIAQVGEKPMSYHQMEQEVKKIAANLLARGVTKGDKVAIIGDNSPNWVLAYLSTNYIGAVAVPILTGFPETNMRHILRNSGAIAVFIASKQFSKIEGMEKSSLNTVYSLEDMTYQDWSGKNGVKHEIPDLPADAAIEYPEPEPDDLAVLIYTSGTTGLSKGVMLTNKNIASDTVNSLEKFPLTPDDRFLSILPLAHTYEANGGLLCPLATGVSIYYMQGLPTPKKLLDSMNIVHPTGVLTVPLIIDKVYRKKIIPQIESKKITKMLYKVPFFRKKMNKVAGKKVIESFGGKLRFFMFGGAALNEDVEIFLRDAQISYSTGYGMTETSPIMTINPFGKVKMGSAGQPIPNIKMRINNPDAKTNIGEIVVKGDIVMQGYYKNEAATKDVFLEDGWLRTGDLGFFDEDGYLFIKGRSKNVIIGPSGENIYPEIIEQQLMTNSYVAEVVVYEDNGRVMAKVYPDYDVIDEQIKQQKRDDSEVQKIIIDLLEGVRTECNEELPEFSKISKIIEHPEPFEKTPTNKVKRYLYIPQ